LLSSLRDAASSSRQRLQLLQHAGAHAASQQQQQRTGNSGGAGLCAHRSAVTSTVQQHRHSYSPPEARPHSHSHHREPPRDDGSVKVCESAAVAAVDACDQQASAACLHACGMLRRHLHGGSGRPACAGCGCSAAP
jgi:hypothetical protein